MQWLFKQINHFYSYSIDKFTNLRLICVSTVRKDSRKYARVKDLLTMNEELKKARKAFDEVKYAGTVKE